jgi:copper transport protein
MMLVGACGSAIPGPSTSGQPSSTFTPQQAATVLPFPATIKTLDGAFTITLDVTPNHAGNNQFSVLVLDNQTSKPAAQVVLTLYITMQDMPMGTTSLTLHADGNGHFSANGANLSMAGHWAIGIVVQTADHVEHKAGVSFVILQ